MTLVVLVLVVAYVAIGAVLVGWGTTRSAARLDLSTGSDILVAFLAALVWPVPVLIGLFLRLVAWGGRRSSTPPPAPGPIEDVYDADAHMVFKRVGWEAFTERHPDQFAGAVHWALEGLVAACAQVGVEPIGRLEVEAQHSPDLAEFNTVEYVLRLWLASGRCPRCGVPTTSRPDPALPEKRGTPPPGHVCRTALVTA